jgi:hypothetical protein
MQPRIEEARRALQRQSLAELARRSGGEATEDRLSVPLFGTTYAIEWPAVVVRSIAVGDVTEEVIILLLDYLVRADGSPLTGRWIGFQELPDGAFYRRAFQGYTGDQLVRELDGEVAGFRDAAQRSGGRAIDLGDAGYAFEVLPRVRLAIVWWCADEEFPAKAHVLFDEASPVYLPTDGLAIVGRMLCRSVAAHGPQGGPA